MFVCQNVSIVDFCNGGSAVARGWRRCLCHTHGSRTAVAGKPSIYGSWQFLVWTRADLIIVLILFQKSFFCRGHLFTTHAVSTGGACLEKNVSPANYDVLSRLILQSTLIDPGLNFSSRPFVRCRM